MRDQAAEARNTAERHPRRCLFSLGRISRRQSYPALHATVYGVIELTDIDSDLDLVLVGDIEQAVSQRVGPGLAALQTTNGVHMDPVDPCVGVFGNIAGEVYHLLVGRIDGHQLGHIGGALHQEAD